MSCRLSDLPLDILRNIIEGLLRDDSESPESPEFPEFPGTRRDRLNYHSHKLESWSRTSLFFYDLLIPYILEVVELKNEDWSGTWLNDLASGEYACLVKEIRFVGSAPGYEESESESHEESGSESHEESESESHEESESESGNEAFSDTTGILPQSVETVLSNLHLFPSLDSLSIEFTYTLEDLPDDDQISVEVESEEQVEAVEKKEAWRALMAKTYQALTKNTEMNIRDLTLKNLLFKRVSTFTCQSFHDLLSHVETFSLSLQGGNDTQYEIGKSYEYESFASNLDRFFFDHLSHVTSVTIKATESGPLGTDSSIRGLSFSSVPLALRKDQMPFLKHVHLEYIVVCVNMIEFLIGHNTTLEHISLRDCFICTMGTDPDAEVIDDIYWEHLFNALYNADLEKLRRVEILPLDVPLTDTYEKERYERKAREIREILEDPGSDRRLFAYAEVHDSYGWYTPSVGMNQLSFERGRDQVSYDKLMEKVNAIAANERRAIMC